MLLPRANDLSEPESGYTARTVDHAIHAEVDTNSPRKLPHSRSNQLPCLALSQPCNSDAWDAVTPAARVNHRTTSSCRFLA